MGTRIMTNLRNSPHEQRSSSAQSKARCSSKSLSSQCIGLFLEIFRGLQRHSIGVMEGFNKRLYRDSTEIIKSLHMRGLSWAHMGII